MTIITVSMLLVASLHRTDAITHQQKRQALAQANDNDKNDKNKIFSGYMKILLME